MFAGVMMLVTLAAARATAAAAAAHLAGGCAAAAHPARHVTHIHGRALVSLKQPIQKSRSLALHCVYVRCDRVFSKFLTYL
jgi:hypothetical protein